MCFTIKSTVEERYNCVGSIKINNKTENMYVKQGIVTSGSRTPKVATKDIICYKRVTKLGISKRYKGENNYAGGLTYTLGKKAIQNIIINTKGTIDVGLHSFASTKTLGVEAKDFPRLNKDYKLRSAHLRYVKCVIPKGASYFTDGAYNVSNELIITKEY